MFNIFPDIFLDFVDSKGGTSCLIGKKQKEKGEGKKETLN